MGKWSQGIIDTIVNIADKSVALDKKIDDEILELLQTDDITVESVQWSKLELDFCSYCTCVPFLGFEEEKLLWTN